MRAKPWDPRATIARAPLLCNAARILHFSSKAKSMTTEAGPEDQMRQVTAVCRKPVKAVLSASSTVRGDVWAST